MSQPGRAVPRRIAMWMFLFAVCMGAIGSGSVDATPTQPSQKTAQVAPKHMWAMGLRTPALSPDGQTIAFGYQGDIWLVPSKGGHASRLTAHPGYDSRPRWSTDGKQLLFTSKRSGSSDVYVIPSKGGYPRRLTHHSATDIGLDWSSDGAWILFESNRENIRSLYKLPINGGVPARLVPGYWNLAHGGRLGPNAQRLLFSEGMESLSYWWRKGYRGPNHGRIHVYTIKGHKSQQRSKGPHSELWPMWAPSGKGYYFVSDKKGVHNLWYASFSGAKATPITSFRQGPVRWPAIARKGGHIVYERDFGIWLTSLNDKRSWQVPIVIASDNPRPHEHWITAKKVTEFALSPDGKKLAFVMEGEVFVSDANGRTTVRRLTNTPWREQGVFWGKDSLHVHYTSERGQGFLLLRRTAMLDKPEETLYSHPKMLLYPRPSPDGKYIVFLQGKNDWMLLKVGSTTPRLLVSAQIGGLLNDPPQWSPDSQWIMYTAYERGRGSLWARHIDPKKPAIRLTQTAAHDGDGAWSPDGKYILYRSNRYGSDWFHKVGDTDLYVLKTHRLKQRFREDKLDKLFKNPKTSKVPSGKQASKKLGNKPGKTPARKPLDKRTAPKPRGQKAKPVPNRRPHKPRPGPRTSPPARRRPAPSKPTSRRSKATPKAKTTKPKKKKKKKKIQVKLEPKGLKHRVRRVTSMKGNEGWPIPGPKGKQLLFFSNATGRYQLYLAKFKHGRVVGARIIAKGVRFRNGWGSHGLQWHPKGKAAYILHRGSIVKIALPKGRTRRLKLRHRFQYDRQSRFVQNFREVWLVLRDHFYDPKMNGQDWDALYKRFLPAIQRVQTKEDWRDLVNEMLGYLNASHLGAYHKRDKPLFRTGALGADLRAKGKHLVITRIYPQGPIDKAMPSLKTKLKSGQVRITEIQGRYASGLRNPYPLLQNTRGKRLVLTLSLPAKGKKQGRVTHKLKLRPIGYWQARRLRYRAWVEARKALVKKRSKGRIGYLHMPNMGRGALYNFIRDFETDAANKAAAIIDLRFNFGGNVHDRVLQYLSRRRYASWGLRGLKRWPEPGHAVHPSPMAMLINEGSLSDAEMTANGFKALKLGTLIGEPTYRWLIFTYRGSLLGGGAYRIPEWGCYTTSGKDLEKIGVTPHIRIRNTLDDRVHGRDPQLEKAIQEMMKQAKLN